MGISSVHRTRGRAIAFVFLTLLFSWAILIPPVLSASGTTKEIQSVPNLLHIPQPSSVSGSIQLENMHDDLDNADCFFRVDASDLDGKIPTDISERIRQAPTLNRTEVTYDVGPPSIDVSGGSWFEGDQGIDPNHAVQLIKQFNFNLNKDLSENRTGHSVLSETQWYTCSFVYEQRVYDILFLLRLPLEIIDPNGHVQVPITPEIISENPVLSKNMITVYEPFNNTIVWTNQLNSSVTVEANYTDVSNNESFTLTNGSSSKQIPPGEMLVLDLYPNWYNEPITGESGIGDRIYSYRISEYPWINGSILVSTKYSHKESSDCYGMEIAKSLYSQFNYELKFPSYLPKGYAPVCYFTGSEFTQVYSNPAREFGKFTVDPNDSFLIGIQRKGIITIHSGKDPVLKLNTTAHERFQNMIKNSVIPVDSQFLVIDGMSVMAYVKDGASMVDIFPNDDEYYSVRGKVPLEELIKMAASLYDGEAIDSQEKWKTALTIGKYEYSDPPKPDQIFKVYYRAINGSAEKMGMNSFRVASNGNGTLEIMWPRNYPYTNEVGNTAPNSENPVVILDIEPYPEIISAMHETTTDCFFIFSIPFTGNQSIGLAWSYLLWGEPHHGDKVLDNCLPQALVENVSVLRDGSISPLQQVRAGIEPRDILCNGNRMLIVNMNDKPYCASEHKVIQLRNIWQNNGAMCFEAVKYARWECNFRQ